MSALQHHHIILSCFDLVLSLSIHLAMATLIGQIQGDFCHRRSIKCRPDPSNSKSCQNCEDFDISCTYNRPLKRGRAAPRHTSPIDSEPLGDSTDKQQQERHYHHLDSRPTHLAPSNQCANATTTVTSAEKSRERSLLGGYSGDYSLSTKQEELPKPAWTAFAAASTSTIEYLIDVYLRVVYPM
jgi:hypothetical protein